MKYQPEHITFLEANIKGRIIPELTKMFNEHFGLDVPENSIRAACKNRGLSSGVDSKFQKGQKPWCTGTKGLLKGSSTSFKKGHRPHNWCPVGTERPTTDGYLRIKIAEPNVWEFKHLLVWVSAYGPLPKKGQLILFADGNKLNCSPENLISISRAENLVLNRWHAGAVDAELTKTKVNLVRVSITISKKKKTLNQNEKKQISDGERWEIKIKSSKRSKSALPFPKVLMNMKRPQLSTMLASSWINTI